MPRGPYPILVPCYSGLIVPVVGDGVVSGFIGDFSASAVSALSILLAVLSVSVLGGIRRAL